MYLYIHTQNYGITKYVTAISIGVMAGFCQDEPKRNMKLRSPQHPEVKKKVKLYLCLTNWTLHHEGVWGSGCIDPHFLDLDTSWRWVCFTPRQLYPRRKSPPYPLDEAGWAPELVWTTWRRENSWSPETRKYWFNNYSAGIHINPRVSVRRVWLRDVINAICPLNDWDDTCVSCL
jgi:hypothetical protein